MEIVSDPRGIVVNVFADCAGKNTQITSNIGGIARARYGVSELSRDDRFDPEDDCAYVAVLVQELPYTVVSWRTITPQGCREA